MGAKPEKGSSLERHLARSGFVVVSIISLLSGCANSPSHEYSSLYRNGDYTKAAESVISESKLNPERASGPLLPYLYTGSALLAAGSHEDSIRYFDHAEEVMKEQDLAIMGKAASQFGAIVMNDNVMDYRRREYDGIMVNGYKSLSFLALGQMELARVELLRADERQRRAVERFSKLIQNNQEELHREKSKNSGAQVDRILENPGNASQLNKLLGDLETWGSYADFVNPFVTYLHGLYFLVMGEGATDIERAVSSFERVYGMTQSQVAERDLALANRIVTGGVGKNSIDDFVWVIFENGMGPFKVENRIELFIPFENFSYVGIAVPELVRGQSAYSFLDVFGDGQQLAATEVVCRMDSIIAAEFKQELPMIYTRAVTSAAIKTYAQVTASRNIEKTRGDASGFFAAIALGLLQAATTKADLRIWESLPRDFQIARCDRPESGSVELQLPGGAGTIAHIDLPEGPVIIWVKIPAPGGLPLVEVISKNTPITSVN